jgi:phosphoesterase RecJ-like protein
VAEMGYYLLKDLNIEFDRSIATALLTGINTDTSSFQNQNTSGLSLEISSDLMLHGARLGFINKKIESATTINKLKLIGTAFNRLSFSTKYKTAVSYLTYKDFEETGMTGALSNSEVVNTLNQIKGAKMVMFIAEQEPGMIHVSFRTRDKDVDVAKIAQFLGGGGHVKAAGFTFEGKISDDGSGVKVIP